MTEQLVAIALYVFTALGAGKSPEALPVARAIAAAVEREPSPASGESHAVDVALLADYAAHESGVSTHPTPWSWDARAGLSQGVWQLRWYLVKGRPLEAQASTWLESLRRAGLGRGVDSSPSRAARRLAEARRLLSEALTAGTEPPASRMAP